MSRPKETKGDIMGFTFNKKLPIPKEIKAMYPLSEKCAAIKAQRDKEIRDVITGADDRFLIIIGPCSADNETAVMDYLHRLVPVQDKIKDKCIIIPRIYTNKPRTTGEGYKGMVHQPDPEAAPDLLAGLVAIRKLLIRNIEETGLTAADEMLYPENWWYLSDLLSYVAVGARSVEDQQHRLTVSGFDVPAGMKNPTSGDMTVMLNSVVAAQHAHNFIYRGWDVNTGGNPLAHTVLRGAVNKRGANSNKQYLEQIRITKEVLHSRQYNPDIHKLVKGLMIESYIEDGSQGIHDKVYGKSITDPCLGWEKTERLLYEIAEKC